MDSHKDHTMTDPAQIVRSLSKAQREVVYLLSDWGAGPDLPDFALEEIGFLRSINIVKRQFRDMGAPETSERIDGFSISVGACWWFCLTPLGLAVRAELEKMAT